MHFSILTRGKIIINISSLTNEGILFILVTMENILIEMNMKKWDLSSRIAKAKNDLIGVCQFDKVLKILKPILPDKLNLANINFETHEFNNFASNKIDFLEDSSTISSRMTLKNLGRDYLQESENTEHELEQLSKEFSDDSTQMSQSQPDSQSQDSLSPVATGLENPGPSHRTYPTLSFVRERLRLKKLKR